MANGSGVRAEQDCRPVVAGTGPHRRCRDLASPCFLDDIESSADAHPSLRMPFPESTRVVFAKNPLTQVVAQIQFPPILAIRATDPAEFQGRIRDRYPLYQNTPTAEFPSALVGVLQQLNVPFQATRHIFSSADGQRSIVLAPEFVAVEDKRYTRWEKFSSDIELALDALQEIYKPAFYGRTGLRYVNRIDRERLDLQSEPWTSLINDRLIGILGDPAVQDELAEVMAVAVVHLVGVPGGSVRLVYGLQPQPTTGDATIAVKHVYNIDADFSTEQRSLRADVTANLRRFHDFTGKLFRWATTERLRSALEPTALE